MRIALLVTLALSLPLAAQTPDLTQPGSWSRVLVPLPPASTPGANDSLWLTDVRALISASAAPPLVETPCGPVEDPCIRPILNQSFHPLGDLIKATAGPQFVYIGKADADKLTMTTQVRNTRESLLTAGAFLPMARDAAFSPNGFALISVSTWGPFRATLRIYDASAINDRDVELALYDEISDSREPFLRQTVRLRLVDTQEHVTPALLPRYPAMAQLDLDPLVPESIRAVRMTVRPVGAPQPAMQLWGFASITNNSTSHVSVIAP
ncbi:MAG: hypothetical protein JOZ54_06420 [Acidobacteria bacterium]|nr:hypothetical protein [Acidobacteriota bacterium]